jgi:hypothetical protein
VETHTHTRIQEKMMMRREVLRVRAGELVFVFVCDAVSDKVWVGCCKNGRQHIPTTPHHHYHHRLTI